MDRHAFLILAHNNWEQLKLLVGVLDDQRNDIYIHINKSINLHKENERLFSEIENSTVKSKIFFIRQHQTDWGTDQFLYAILDFLETAHKNGPYLYYHDLTVSDLPIKSMDELHIFFNDLNRGKEFVHFAGNPPINKKVYERYSLYTISQKYVKRFGLDHKLTVQGILVNIIGKMFKVMQRLVKVDRQRNNPYTLCFGACWFSITDSLACHLVENKRWVWRYFHNTFAPDECCIQTLVYASEYRKHLFYSVMDNNYVSCQRLVDWKRGNPYVWRNTDYKTLIDAPFIFARKFDLATDRDIIDSITKHITNPNPNRRKETV